MPKHNNTKRTYHPIASQVRFLVEANSEFEAKLRTIPSDSERQNIQAKIKANLERLDNIARILERNPIKIKLACDEIYKKAETREWMVRNIAFFLHFLQEDGVITHKKTSTSVVGSREVLNISYRVAGSTVNLTY